MPRQEEKKNDKMVDIDTTGPGAEVELTRRKGNSECYRNGPSKGTQMKKLSKTTIQPADTSEKSDESAWLFEIARTIKNKINRKMKN